jgi:radical SAM superfamily enzyme YgiQ (UPF0313 family)
VKVLHVTRTLPQEMLGPMYLSRVARDAGHEFRAICHPDPLWMKKIRDYRPDVVTYSVMTGNHKPIYDLNRFLKAKFDFFAILGGPHPTFVPDSAKEQGIDAICIGEGEGAIVDLLNSLQAGEDWRGIPNLAFANGDGEIVKNPPRALITDLDALGFPDREPIYEAQPLYGDNPRKVFLTQRGCPMECTFCFHHAWKNKIYGAQNKVYVRKRSVDHIIEEVNRVRRRWPLRFVHFLDDIFNIRGDWLEEFSERWPREVGLPFDVILMANMTRKEHIRQLKDAGCIYARIAFESANDHIRNAIYKKNTEREELVQVSSWIKEYGIRLGSLNMLGAPGGTVEDDFDTVQLNIECKVDHPLCSIVQPYPEFELNEITKGMGIAVSEYDEFPSQFNREASIQSQEKHEIESLHKWFPMLVRNPRLMPAARWSVKRRWLKRPLLALYALYSEWLVTEQNMLYERAQGRRGIATFAAVDYVRRVSQKIFVRVVGKVGAKVVQKLSTRLAMTDERVAAHMD